MEKKIKDLKKDFAQFVEQIPEYLNLLNEKVGEELSFVLEDIDKVENFYEKNFLNPEKIGLDIETLNNMFYAFIGEAFIYYNGGKWILSDLKRDRAYGTPLITESRNTKFRTSPYIWKEYIVRDLEREPISKIIELMPPSV